MPGDPPGELAPALDVLPHHVPLSGRARDALRRRRSTRRPMQRRLASRPAPAGNRRRRPDRSLPADHLRSVPRPGHTLGDGRGRPRRAHARDAEDPRAGAPLAGMALAARRARARVRAGAGPGPLCGPAHLLLLHGPRRLRGPHDGRRFPAASRPALHPSGSAQLLRAVHQQLLQHELPLRLGHAVRRQRLPAGASPDLGLPAVQRVHARRRRRPGLAARAANGPGSRVGRAGGAEHHRAGARLRLRAGRVPEGDHRAGDDPHDGRAGRPAPPLAERPARRRNPVRARGRRRGLGARCGRSAPGCWRRRWSSP